MFHNYVNFKNINVVLYITLTTLKKLVNRRKEKEGDNESDHFAAMMNIFSNPTFITIKTDHASP